MLTEAQIDQIMDLAGNWARARGKVEASQHYDALEAHLRTLAAVAAAQPQPDPVVMQYLALTDAMHYEAGPQLLSAEEYAAALYLDAARYRWLRDKAFGVEHRDMSEELPIAGVWRKFDEVEPREGKALDDAIDAAMQAHGASTPNA